MTRIYLDHNATTPLDPRVLEAMLPYLGEGFGNPSSLHSFGQTALRALDRARRQVANLIHAAPEEIVFESGGTESDNHAVVGTALARLKQGGHIVTTSVEHEAVGAACSHLETLGFTVTRLKVDGQGRVDPDEAVAAIQEDTFLITVMLANNEVGTIQPVRKIAAVARERGIAMHTDAVQAVGKIAVDVRELGVDLLSFSGHKLHGPKGAGALYVRRGTPLQSLVHGGHHEKNRRAGTENVAALAGFGRACEIAMQTLGEDGTAVAGLRDRLEAGIVAQIEGVRVNRCPGQCLPNTLSVSFPDLDGEFIMMSLDLEGVAVSTGSACTSGNAQPSFVLRAMGRSPEEARGTIRFSLGRGNTEEEIDRVLEILTGTVHRLRQAYPS